MHSHFRPAFRLVPAAALFLTLFSHSAFAQSASSPSDRQTTAGDEVSTNTDFLSDDNWRRLPREERRKRSRASYIARFEPSGNPTVDRLDEYVDRFGRINVYDSRLLLYRVRAEHVPGTTGTVILTGEVSVPQYARGIEETLGMLGFNVERNEIAVLPSPQLGTKRYAVSTTAVATVRKEPRTQAEQVTSVGMGGWVRLLRKAQPDDLTTSGRHRSGRDSEIPEEQGLWYLAQTSEGYLGFMRDEELSRTAELPHPDAMVLLPTTVTVTLNGGGESKVAIPAGAFVYSSDSAPDRYTLAHSSTVLPENLSVVPLGKPAFTEQEILEFAKPLMGVRYVWGGVTGQGIDCSGFTQFMLRTRGITLPRDAEEQATVGQIVAFGQDVARLAEPGDLVFFTNGRGKINHIAMSLGNGRIIHSSGRDVHISSLDEVKDEEEGTTRLDSVIFARRVQGR